MKKWLKPLLLGLVLAVGALGVTALEIGAPVSAANDPIKALDEAWMKAALAGDVEAMTALYAPDAVLYTPGIMEARGTEAIRKENQSLLGQFTIKDPKFDFMYETTGSVSISHGRWKMTAVPKAGGDPQVWEGRATAVAKRINGKWLYVIDHASMPMPAPPAAKPSAP